MKVYDVFVSYRRSDGREIAESLYAYLSARRLRVFLDREEMVDGHYFTAQLEDKVRIIPNYILIGTADVWRAKTGETDWVHKEIAIATAAYQPDNKERTITVLLPEGVRIPEEKTLPEEIRDIVKAQMIFMPAGEDYREPFYRALKAVTEVNRRNLWQAAHRWLEDSKQPGGRFASLNISQSILPNAATPQSNNAQMPILVCDEKNAKQPLLEAVSATNRHHYLIGEGGIGKTTALMHIMNGAYAGKDYSPKGQIPIFVELSFAPDTYGALYEGGRSSFIRRAIFKQLRSDRSIKQVSAREVSDIDEVFALTPYDVAVKPITDVLAQVTPMPEYLLLLDGLNEVSSVMIAETGLTVAQMVAAEIELLLTECPNVRVILTSRSDEVSLGEEQISRLRLTGIEDSVIEDYLEKAGLPKECIGKALSDENLRETLRIPLFLTMYASLSQSEGVSTQGEILKTFFSERRKNVTVYTAQERLAAVEKNVSRTASLVQKKRIRADIQNFIMDFLLPEIAWYLERRGEFYLRIRDVCKIIAPVLSDTSDTAVCGEFGRELFAKYRKGASAKQHTYQISKELRMRFSETGDMAEVAENVIECSIFSLGILQESNGKYGFIHQHIRDYFAAVKNINTLRLADYLLEEGEKGSALACMNSAFLEEPVGYRVRRFMGEHLREYQNKPHFANDKYSSSVPAEKCERTLIERTLAVYRNAAAETTGYGLYSLLKLLEEARGVLAGIDLSDLDLSGCNLNAAGLGIPGLAAKLNRATIRKESMFPTGHTSWVKDVRFNADGTKVLSAGSDGTVKIWNVKTGTLLANLPHRGAVRAARFIGGETEILSVCSAKGDMQWDNSENFICRWDLASGELVSQTESLAFADKFAISKDERYILIATPYALQVLAADDLTLICELLTEEGTGLTDVCFVGNGAQIAVLLQIKRSLESEGKTRLEIWDAETSQEEGNIIVPGTGVALAASDEERISVFTQDQTNGEIIEWVYDTNTLQPLGEFVCYEGCREIAAGTTMAENWQMAHSVTYSKNGLWFAIAFERQVNLYSAKAKSLIHSFSLNRCWTADFDPTDSCVVFGSAYGEVLTYSISSFSPVSMIKGAVSDIYSFAFSPDCRYIATMGGRLELWDADALTLVNQKHIRRGPFNVMKFSPAGDMIHNWPGGNGLLRVPSLQTAAAFIEGLRFDRNGIYYATIKHTDHLVQSMIYDLKDLHPVCTLNDLLVTGFVDHKAIALCDIKKGDYNKTYSSVAIVEIPSGKILQKLSIPGEFVKTVRAGDGCIAALSLKGTIALWGAADYALLGQMGSVLRDQRQNTHVDITLSDDGKYLLEYSREKTIVRDSQTLKEVATLDGEFIQCTSGYLTAITKFDHAYNRKIYIYRRDTFELLYCYTMSGVPSGLAVDMNFAYISPDETRILLREGENAVGVYRLPDAGNAVARIGEIISEHGMDYQGVNLSTVRLDKALTDDEKAALRRYGAIIA